MVPSPRLTDTTDGPDAIAFTGVMRRPVLAIIAVLLPILLAGCSTDGLSFLTPGGPAARSELSHFVVITLVALIAIVPVFLFVPWLLWRYRLRGGRGEFEPKWDYSRNLELVMWGVPVLIVCVLGLQLTRNAYENDPYRRIDPARPALRIEVVALNWKWLFIYPEQGIATVDHLTIPIGVPVEFRLTSDSVMQSFMVSALAGQIYVMPGMETREYLRADTAGRYVGRNTQYNGPDFAGQRFVLSAVPPAEFADWIVETRGKGPPMDERAYAVLAAPSTGAAAARALGVAEGTPLRFGAIPSDLYTSILHRYMSPKGVPARAQPGAPDFAGLPPVSPVQRHPGSTR